MNFYKKIIFSFILLLYFTGIQAQLGWWTWMHGSNSGINVAVSNGTFGTQGTAAPNNDPPRSFNGADWTDLNGNFWMFGGSGPLPDVLWKFDPTTNMWTWVKGPNVANSPGVYGTQGTPSPANYPGSRLQGMFTWTDLNGDLWLYGGWGFGPTAAQGLLNDLWRYNIASNQWTWMHGNNVATPWPGGDYGTQGVPAATNIPPCRREGSTSWTDNNGNLWLFGGESAFGAMGLSNDLWKYDVTTNMWTWMRGSSVIGSLGNYGAQGVAAATNDPPARRCYTHWKDSNGNLWMFGGDDYANIYNDLWKYDITTNMWTWVRGSNMPNPTPNYGTKCVSNINDDPPARTQNQACWVDKCDNFWMFGGRNNLGNNFNDMWHYDVAANTWTWVSGGPGAMASHGTMNIPAASNMPEPRSNSMAFTQSNGDLWLFGGNYPFVGNNDMWRFVIDTNCVNWCSLPQVVTAGFTSNVQNGCASLTVNFTNTSSINATSWNWNFGDGNADTIQNPSHTYPNPGTYTVTLIASNGTVSDTTTSVINVYANAVAVFNITANDTICLGQSVTFNNTSTNSNASSWNFGDGNTSTNISPTHTYGANGNYAVTLIAQNPNGCNDTITQNIFVTGAQINPSNPISISCINPTGVISASSSTPNVTYNWAGPGIISGNNNDSATVNTAGTYTCIVTDPVSGCTNSTTVTVTNSSISFAGVSPDITILLGSNTSLTATGGGTYNWFPATGLNNTNSNTVTATPNQTTTYCVEVTDTSGCKDTACVTVFVEIPCPDENLLAVPNAFSPNADNVNDEFCLQGWTPCNEEFLISIFDRWGEKVYESKDPNFCWDGTHKTKIMDAQVFTYYIKAKFTEKNKIFIKKGNITLLR